MTFDPQDFKQDA